MGVKEERKFYLIEEEMESAPRRYDMSNLFHDHEWQDQRHHRKKYKDLLGSKPKGMFTVRIRHWEDKGKNMPEKQKTHCVRRDIKYVRLFFMQPVGAWLQCQLLHFTLETGETHTFKALRTHDGCIFSLMDGTFKLEEPWAYFQLLKYAKKMALKFEVFNPYRYFSHSDR